MPYLYELYEQGLKNGVELELIQRKTALKMEPTLRGYGDEVIHSPHTSVMDTAQAMTHLTETLPDNVVLTHNANITGLQSCENTKTCSVKYADSTNAAQEAIEAKLFINAAGLGALKLAHSQGLAERFAMLPLKGRYAISKESSMGNMYNMLVYPVPVKGAFVLGTHSTLAINGHVKLGPTVFPAFSPENYDMFENINAEGLKNSLHAFTKVALSSKSRGLIKLFLTEEIKKSMSIKTLLSQASKFQSFGDGSTAELASRFRFYRAGIRP